jgi:signal peptidase II
VVASVQPLPGAAQPTAIIGDLVRIAKNYNTGGIFGLFGDSALLLALASTFVIAMIVVYQGTEGMRSPWLLNVALGLLLGGAIGNLIDRLRLGAVIDFVDMGIGSFRWYTFNVADASISTALLLLILLTLFGEWLGRRLALTAG